MTTHSPPHSRLRVVTRCVFATLLVVGLLVGTARISIPTDTNTRVIPWVFDPVDPPIDTTGVPLTHQPVVVVARTGNARIRRLDLFTRVPQGKATDLQVELFSEDRRELLGEATVNATQVVDMGLTIVQFPQVMRSDVVRIELTGVPDPGSTVSSAIELQGFGDVVPGLTVQPGTVPDGVAGLGMRVFDETQSPWARVALMYERTMDRWPAWNGAVIPVALFAFAALTAGLCAFFVTRLLMAPRLHVRIGSALIVAAVVGPMLIYVLKNR